MKCSLNSKTHVGLKTYFEMYLEFRKCFVLFCQKIGRSSSLFIPPIFPLNILLFIITAKLLIDQFCKVCFYWEIFGFTRHKTVSSNYMYIVIVMQSIMEKPTLSLRRHTTMLLFTVHLLLDDHHLHSVLLKLFHTSPQYMKFSMNYIQYLVFTVFCSFWK